MKTILCDDGNIVRIHSSSITPEEKELQRKRLHDATVMFLKKAQTFNKARGVSNG